jgi:hypothetical protein
VMEFRVGRASRLIANILMSTHSATNCSGLGPERVLSLPADSAGPIDLKIRAQCSLLPIQPSQQAWDDAFGLFSPSR